MNNHILNTVFFSYPLFKQLWSDLLSPVFDYHLFVCEIAILSIVIVCTLIKVARKEQTLLSVNSWILTLFIIYFFTTTSFPNSTIEESPKEFSYVDIVRPAARHIFGEETLFNAQTLLFSYVYYSALVVFVVFKSYKETHKNWLLFKLQLMFISTLYVFALFAWRLHFAAGRKDFDFANYFAAQVSYLSDLEDADEFFELVSSQSFVVYMRLRQENKELLKEKRVKSELYNSTNRLDFLHFLYPNSAFELESVYFLPRTFKQKTAGSSYLAMSGAVFLVSATVLRWYYRTHFYNLLLDLKRRVAETKVDPFSGKAERRKKTYPVFRELELKAKSLSRFLALSYGSIGQSVLRKSFGSDKMSLEVKGTRVEGVFVFFVIRNFHKLLGDPSLAAMQRINALVESIHDAVAKHNGHINRTLGKETLCFWETPLTPEMFAEILFCVAFCCKNALHRYNCNLEVGVHAGTALAGPIGSPAKIDFTFISKDVNTTARICSITKFYEERVLFSKSFVSGLSEEKQTLLFPVDLVYLKGSGSPVELFGVRFENAEDKELFFAELSHEKDKVQKIKHFFEIYKKGLFDECMESYKEIASFYPTGKILMDRLRNKNNMENGVYKLDFK